LSAVDYHNLMFDRLDEVSDERINALGEIKRDKFRVEPTIRESKEKIISDWRSHLKDDFAYQIQN
jgi:hypothetical protein